MRHNILNTSKERLLNTKKAVIKLFRRTLPQVQPKYIHQCPTRFRFFFLPFLLCTLCTSWSVAGIDSWYSTEVLPAVRGDKASSCGLRAVSSTLDTAPDAPKSNQSLYTVVYGGPDGVNVRQTPSLGDNVIAAAFKQNSAPLTITSTNPIVVDGIPWVQVEVSGWLAYRKVSRTFSYLQETGEGKAKVNWDGGKNPNDNFLMLRVAPGTSSTQIAKIFDGTEILLGRTSLVGSFEWVSILLRGWMATKSTSGRPLLAPYSP